MKRILWLFLGLALLMTGCEKNTEKETLPTESETLTKTIELTLTAETEMQPPEPVFDPYSVMANMTLEEKIGQLFLARCPTVEEAIDDVQEYHLGGYILFGKDFSNQTTLSVRSTIGQYQEVAKIPLLIAVDEEGGSVSRVSCYDQFRSETFRSPRKIYEEGGLELVLETEREKCELLGGLGINVNMAPVCDITTNPKAFMYSRSLGESPEVTGGFIANMVKTMSENRIGGVLKHFPGYGNNADTHVQIATDSRSLEELTSYDLVPFQSGIDAGCDAILVSHTIVKCLDENLPASLSPDVIGYLRTEMGFGGVVVTDDLKMAAITKRYGVGEAAVLAVLADADLLCSSNYWTQYKAVLQACNEGRIPLEQIEDSVARILQWKYDLGLITLDR